MRIFSKEDSNKMKQWMKQSLALLLCLCMLCAALPAAEVSAEEIDVIPVPEEEAGDEIVILDEDDLAPTAPNGETPSITTQPSSKKTCVGYGVSFTVKAENATKYQWYYRASSSADWVKVPEDTATKSTLTYSAVGLGLNGFQYRCKVSNSYGSLYSNTVKLTVTIEPAITTQPKSKTVDPGETAKFTVKATGALSYQWYWRTSKSAAWQVSTLTGNKTATLSVVGKASRSGYQYRCLVANGQAYTYTNTVTLTVTDSGKPSITTQPESITASVGATAKFTVKASGATKYQWYYRTSSTGSWHAASLTGNKTASLSVPATSARSGYQYRCKVSNASGYVYTRAVTLTVKSGAKPSITSQPSSITKAQDYTAKFTVKASNATKYQWYYRTSASGSWSKTTLTGATTATLSVKATSARSGYQYRCKVSNANGYVYSNTVTLTVNLVKYRALLVGEVNFSWETANRNRGDVTLMKEMLSSVTGPKGGKYTITCKYDLDNSGLKSAIKSAFSGADSNDVSLFFIATHGVTDVASGTYAGELVTIGSDGYSEYMTLSELATCLKAVPGKVIVLLGSCGSGAAIISNGDGEVRFVPNYSDEAALQFCGAAIEAFAAADELLPNEDGVANTGEFRESKFYVMTAAAHQESSWGYEGSNPHNIFPYYFAKGAGTGKPADANGNGTITMLELFNYIDSYALSEGPQHTQMYPANSTYALFK